MCHSEHSGDSLHDRNPGTIGYRVRKMLWDDVEQVRGIDLFCFPTMLPPTNYKTEFINPMAHYLVAYTGPSYDTVADTENPKTLILGFIGLWYLAGEIHVINLAVHPDFRSIGVGELLLIRGIEVAIRLRAILVTLEVRVSNIEAKALYSKYGFSERGIRRAYYLDNREDAAIMTLEQMESPAYIKKLQQLYRTWSEKTGISSETNED